MQPLHEGFMRGENLMKNNLPVLYEKDVVEIQ